MKVKSLSRVRLYVTPWTVAYQAPPSMGFSRQEYWSGLPFPIPRDLPDPGIKPAALASPAKADGLLTMSATWEASPLHKSLQTANFPSCNHAQLLYWDTVQYLKILYDKI